jgi:hypothetical protein
MSTFNSEVVVKRQLATSLPRPVHRMSQRKKKNDKEESHKRLLPISSTFPSHSSPNNSQQCTGLAIHAAQGPVSYGAQLTTGSGE